MRAEPRPAGHHAVEGAGSTLVWQGDGVVLLTTLMKTKLIDTRNLLTLTEVRSHQRSAQGVLFQVDDELFRVDVLGEGLFRLKISHGCSFDEQPTYAVSAAPTEFVPFTTEAGGEHIEIRTERMLLRVWKKPFRVDAYRADGSVVFESHAASHAPAWRRESTDGDPVIANESGYAFLNDGFVISRKLGPHDAIYGLGEKTGPFNRRGKQYVLWNHDVAATHTVAANRLEKARALDAASTDFDPYYISIPFFYHAVSSRGVCRIAGFFVDNGYRGHFDFDDRDVYRYEFLGGQYTEYVFAGPDMASILSDFTRITGRMNPPPIWSLGYHQCRWHDYRQSDVLENAREFRERNIPCDVLWLDIGYMDGYRVFTWDKEKFPDPRSLLEALEKRGLRCVTIVDPGVKYDPGYAVFDEGLEKNLFCKTEGGALYVGQVWPGRTVFPDFAKVETRSWWGRLNAEHVASGLAGIWNDMNEPSTGSVDPFPMRFDRDGENYSHERYHNQYGLLMAMGTREGLLKARPNERTFILSRAGFAGIQRYAANWMGDNCSSWEHLTMSLPMAAGLGISGQPFVGADIPGFFGTPTAEMMVRWMQCGALTPFCRGHNCAGVDEQYPWSFGPGAEKACKKALELRYALLPYLYTAFCQSARTGEPVQRPLLFDFQHDRHAREVEDQYMLGRSLLVAPVTRPGVTARHVYLPAGSWVHYESDASYDGGRVLTVESPLDSIPVFVRGGHVIAGYPDRPQSTMGYQPERIVLEVFAPNEDGSFESELMEDDGLTFDYARGAFFRTRFCLERDAGRMRLRAEVEGQGFAGFRRKEFELHIRNFEAKTLVLNGVSCPGGLTRGAGGLVFENQGQSFEALFESA